MVIIKSSRLKNKAYKTKNTIDISNFKKSVIMLLT